MKPFIYVAKTSSAGILSTANETAVLSISNDSDFVLKEIRTSDDAGLLLSLKNQGGDNYCNESFDASLIGKGTNALKFFDVEYKIPANTKIEVTFDNQTGGNIAAGTYKYVLLIGYKVSRFN